MINDKELKIAKDLLLELLEIETVSGDEERGVRYIYYFLKELGYKNMSLDYLGENSYNLVLNPVKNPLLLITTHIDTVEIISKPREVNEYMISGTGSVDAKGSIVSILLMLMNIERLPDNVSIAILSQEETSGAGSITYLQKNTPKYVIVMEPTDLNIALSGHGYLELEIKVFGKYYHPDALEIKDDIKAINKALKLIDEIKRFVGGEYGIKTEILEIEAKNIGYFVPKECRLHLDFNIPPSVKPLDVMKKIKHRFKKLIDQGEIRIKIREFSDPFQTDEDDFIHKLVEIHERTIKNKTVKPMTSWTDANNFAEKGIKTIIFGPGKLEFAHNEKEMVDLRDIILAKSYLREVIDFIKRKTI